MSLKHLAIASGAGEPDDVPALRIDVVTAAEALTRVADGMRTYPNANAWKAALEDAESALHAKVHRYWRALKRRDKARGMTGVKALSLPERGREGK